jgi:hypothetical protein
LKTCIVHTRIPTARTTGAFDILLPTGFGVPKGFVVYSLTNSSNYDAFNNGTAHVNRSVGFGGSVSTGAATVANVCAWQYNQYNVDPSNGNSSIAYTTAMYDRNNGDTIRRNWYATGFQTDKIVGYFGVTGSPAAPIDMVFTVFGGDDVQCAISGVAVTTTAVHSAATPFQADLALLLHNRPLQTNDVDICFGAAWRITGSGSGATLTRARVSSAHKNADAASTSNVTNRVSNRGTVCLTTTYEIFPAYMGTSSIGFTGSGSATGNTVIALAIKGPSSDDFYVDTFLTPASVGSSFYVTNFVPQLVAGGFNGNPGLNTTYTTEGNGCETTSYFTSTGYTRRNINGVGTITSSTASATVTGTGSSFLFHIGPTDIIKDTNGVTVGTVSSVASNTSLTLTANAAVTLSSQNYVFEKSQQFALAFGVNDADSGTPNEGLVGYSSKDAIISYTCSTTSGTIDNDGYLKDFSGEGNGWSATMTVASSGADYGWYYAIKDQAYHKYRRGVQIMQ